jgi:hypothetical protein
MHLFTYLFIGPESAWLRVGGPAIDPRQYRILSRHHYVQAGSGVHPASYSMNKGDSFPLT